MSDSYKVYASEEYVDKRVPSPDGTHKTLVTDAEGNSKWEERTHWAEEQKEIVIVPETTDNTQSIMGSLSALVLNNPFGNFMPFSVGQSYKVTWDGAEYETVAELEEDGVYMLPVSQGGLSYVLWVANSSPELIAAVVENGYGGTHTIKITCVEQNCKKIDVKKYLPNGYPYAEEKTMPIGTTEITVDKLTDNNLSMDSEALDALSAYQQAMSNAGLNSYDNKFYAICNGNKYLLSFGSVEGSGSTAQWTYACNTADDLSPFVGILFGYVAGFPPLVAPAMPNDATDEDYEAAMARLPLTIEIQGVLPDEVHTLDSKYIPDTIARTSDIPAVVTDDHINELIDAKAELPAGSTAHQMLVTGADGGVKWEERTHWMEEKVTVLFDGEPEFIGSSYGMAEYSVLWQDYQEDNGELFSPDAQYICVFNGSEYPMDVFEDSENELKYAIGYESDSFVLLIKYNSYHKEYRLTVPVQDPTNITLKIIEHSNEIKTLDPKYLPEDHINTLIDSKLEAAHPTELITIPASAWTGTEAPYFAMNQACSIATMTNKLIVSLSPTLASDEDGLNEMLSADTYNAIAKSKLMAVMQADGAITLAAYGKKPEIDIPVIVTEVG